MVMGIVAVEFLLCLYSGKLGERPICDTGI